jgi:cation-transporting P-type ATPase F
MGRFGHRVSIAIVAVSAAAFVVGFVQGVPAVDMFLTAVAIAVAAIPEGLPIVMTVALAVSVRRMARRNAIIRRLPAVETLGSCTIIASDKTGTLTENRMTVQSVWAGGVLYDVTGTGLDVDGEVLHEGGRADVSPETALYRAILAGMLANEADLKHHVKQGEQSRSGMGEAIAQGDPTEVALLVLAAKAGLAREDLLDAWPQIEQIPFEPDRQFSATIHTGSEGAVAFVKGAPERVLEMCDVDPDGRTLDREAALHAAHQMAGQGLRVLAMAMAGGGAIGSVQRIEPQGLMFLGLVGMMDPPRTAAMEAIAHCREAGIRVIMITGDHASTAAAIAGILGLAGPQTDDGDRPPVRTGRELEAMSDIELRDALRSVSVFARVSPSQKLRIVMLLREEGEVVAVTGDGVNDAPALKAAHIGAAMGRSGTDVAREASEMVLADDNFATIYAAVEEGRTAFSNIRKATDFLLSTSVGVVIAIFGAFLLATTGAIPLPGGHVPLLLLPAQILWLNVVTNGIQDVALAFEPGEREQYTRPPRDPRGGLLSRVLVERTVIVGLLLAAVALALFSWELRRGMSLAYAQSATLTAMVIFKMLHVGACRSETRSIFRKSVLSNPVLFVGTSLSLAVHLGALHLPPMQMLLGLQPLERDTWLMIVLSAPSVLLVVEAHKLLRPDRAGPTLRGVGAARTSEPVPSRG